MSSLTPLSDMGPVPRVLIDIPATEFPAGAVTVSLQRTCEGRTMDVVGGQRLPASSSMIVVDPEAGFWVESSYTILGHDASGAVVGSLPAGATMIEFDGVVVQQPLDPRLSVQVRRIVSTAADISRETPSELLYPQGASLPGLVGMGPRRGVQDVTLDLFVSTHADGDALQATLGTYEQRQLPVWLVRTPPGQRIPRIFFCHVPQLNEISINGHIGKEYLQFSAKVTEVRPPARNVSTIGLTHSDMKALFTTHTEVKAQYATHSDIKRDTSLIGAGDA